MGNDINVKFGVGGEKEFKTAISSIDSQIKNLNSEMKLAVSGMSGMDSAEETTAQKMSILERTADATKQKISILSTQYDSAKSRLADLASELEKATAEFGSNSAEAEKAENAYNKQAKAVNDLGTKLNNAKTSLNQTEDAMREIKDDTEGAGKAMDEAGKSASIFGSVLSAEIVASAIINGVKSLASGLKDLAFNSAMWADELVTQSTVTGIATDELQEYYYMTELVDVSVDTITGSLRKLISNMNSASNGTGKAHEAFKALGVSVTDSNGALRDNKEVFAEVLEALQGIDDQTQADAYAMDIFGKSAQELNPLIQMSADQLEALRQEAHDVGYVMSEDMLQANLEASDAYERMKKSTEALKNEIGTALAPTLTALFEKITEGVKNFDEFKDGLETAIPIIAGAGVAVGGLALAMNFTAIVESVTKAFGLFNAVLNMNPIVLIITLIAGLVSALVVAYQTNEVFREKVNNAFASVKEAVTNAVDRVKEAVNTLKELPAKALTWGKDLIDNFIAGIKAKIKALKNAVSDVAQTVKDYLGFSEPDKGPLSNFHTYAPDMIDLFTEGIYQNLGKVEEASSAMASSAMLNAQNGNTTTDAIYNASAGIVNGLGANVAGGAYTINVQLDGRTIASTIFEPLKAESQRRGVALG